MVSIMKWVILFGGAGREACITRMLEEGIEIKAIIVPEKRIENLAQVISKLRDLHCEVVEVSKSGIDNVLGSYAGNALLSIGFPYLIQGEMLALFQPALNLHPTLLPRYRGPTSGAYILINNERESGSTVHHMTSHMDRGDIVLQSRVALSPFDTIRSMQRKVYAQEPELLINALAALNGGVEPVPQDESQASEYPKKRMPADSEVDPGMPLIDLVNQIRACDPSQFPAFFIYKGQKMVIQLHRPDRAGIDDDEM